MSVETARALAEIMRTHNLSRLEYGEGNLRIVLDKAAQTVASRAATDAPAFAEQSGQGAQGAYRDRGEPVGFTDPADFAQYHEVKSPIVGVFYAAPSPESPPFVSIGSQVKQGDVLCIVEAMKLMNEILAEQDGEIVDICMQNGDIAEYGQVLFKMR